MLCLRAAEVDIHHFAHLGIGHRGIDTAVDDRGECISAALCRHIALAYVHPGGQQCSCQTLTCLLIQGCQLLRDRLVFRCLEEETDGIQTDRVHYAVHAYTGAEVHAACLFVLRLHIGFHFLRSRDIQHGLPDRSVESDMTAGIDMERHDRVHFG